MTIETKIVVTDSPKISIWTKLNPIWWFAGPDGWTVPEINNGEPYLPNEHRMWVRRFYWFFCRNPLMNFAAFVAGVEDKTFRVTGPAPVTAVTWRDVVDPPTFGLKWALLKTGVSVGALVVFAVAMAIAIFGGMMGAIAYPTAVVAFFKGIGFCPFVSYWGSNWITKIFSFKPVEMYVGFRPHNGGFGVKLVTHDSTAPAVDGKAIG